MKIERATNAEKAEYRKTDHVYPLWGFVTAGGVRLAIETLAGEWSAPDPIYEVIAPKGKHFEGSAVHSLLCHTLADVRERVAVEPLVDCDESCGVE